MLPCKLLIRLDSQIFELMPTGECYGGPLLKELKLIALSGKNKTECEEKLKEVKECLKLIQEKETKETTVQQSV
jgi:hypothetical protein